MLTFQSFRRALNQRGDTIVEVMMVLAILGLALSISYATANRSLLNSRQAQENAQAAELAQSQVEGIRLLSATPNPVPANQNVFVGSGSNFCVFTSGSSYAVQSPASGGNCNIDAIPYSISDVWQGSGAPNYDQFVVTVSWPDLQGQGNDTVKLTYRTHKP